METQTYVHRDGRTRSVSSVEGGINARAEGFHAPDSPSGRRIASLLEAAAERPAESWTHARLDEYAATAGVTFEDGVKTKADKVAALTAATANVGTATADAGAPDLDTDMDARRVADETTAATDVTV